MAINYASKYSTKVAERFTLKSLTASAVNKDYEWAGVNSINVFSVPTVALNDYTTSGIARYGTPADLQNTVQTMTVAKDRSFSIVIDKKSMDDTQGIMEAGKALARQIDEVIVPEVDVYRLAAMSTAAIANSATTTLAITSSNAYSNLLKASEWFGNKKVPATGRICYCTYAFYNFIKQDTSFMLSSEVAMNERINGMVGMVDGIKIVPVPSTYLPANHAFIMCHPAATVAAEKLEDYKQHDNPPGISGILLEGRVRYDAFVLDSKKDALWAHKIA